MLNKYWNTSKKIEWLNENYTFISDRNWGGSWVYNPEGEGPPYQITVATIDDYNYQKGLSINYDLIK